MTALRFAVLGSPVAHSKSPAMHGAAFRALGMPHAYEKLETSEGELAERIARLRDGTYAGLNVTVPHKTRVLAHVDSQDDSVVATGAANTLVRLPDGSIRAFNTDAPAIAGELLRLARAELEGEGGSEEPARARFVGRSAIVLGTGGAARAAVWALAHLGVATITIRARTEGTFAGRPVVPLAAPDAEEPSLVAIVQATSCGMKGAAPGAIVADAVAWSTVPQDAVALDVVYAPPATPFSEAAAARGLASDTGYGMLARQGALAFERWLGVTPPLDVMLAALRA